MNIEATLDTREGLAGMSPEGTVLVGACLHHERMRRMSTRAAEVSRDAKAASWYAPASVHGQGVMATITNEVPGAAPAASARFESTITLHRSARRSPVLPRGWAPLTDDQQRAVLRACDDAGERRAFRLASQGDPAMEYRVYQLQKEIWAGLWVAARCCNDCDGRVSNRDLLGLSADPVRAMRIALDFFNSDLQARGEPWRLVVESPAAPHGDPRRV
jgi:hypothetical protein